MQETNNEFKLSNFEMVIAINILSHAVCELQFLASLSDCKFCLDDILINLCNELQENYTWCTLENTVINLRNENKDNSRLLKDNIKKSNEQLIQLMCTCVTKEKDFKDKIKEVDIEVSTLKDDIQDANFQQSVEIKYTAKWERSRIDQGLMLAEMEEGRLKYQLESLVYRADTEERIHNEVATYLEDVTNSLEADIESWKEKYKEISLAYDEELSIIKQERDKQLEHLKALTDKYYEHGEKIKEYVEEKRQREQQEALHQHLNSMATKIQAWWRGVMVRRHLGPYKKKGKAKDKPKFKGKGNKSDENPVEKQGKKGK